MGAISPIRELRILRVYLFFIFVSIGKLHFFDKFCIFLDKQTKGNYNKILYYALAEVNMNYISTRGSNSGTSFSEAIIKGLADDKGLFVPMEDVVFTLDELSEMTNDSYTGLAVKIISKFATDFTEDEIRGCVERAYKAPKFPECPVGFKKLNDKLSVLELFHGPTCAFKDMALQLLPEMMSVAIGKIGEKKEITILTATSGDTGKAALEGFRDVDGIKVMVYYPSSGVSEMQKLQMITQEGANVNVKAIHGNFDNAQTGVKEIFSDKEFAKELSARGKMLSSANSINFGRLLPQVIYYFYAYMEMVRTKDVNLGATVNFCVPTGNFGDILACYYAKKAGLPVNRILCASNSNNVVAEFINSGIYNKNRAFITTISPAMDILVSSNLERLLYDATDKNADYVLQLMTELGSFGYYEVGVSAKQKIARDFGSGYANEDETYKTISDVYKTYGYLVDPHTAVGICVYDKYVAASGDTTKTVCVSTASPFKFNTAVAGAIFGDMAISGLSEFQISEYLSEKTGEAVPAPLVGLDKKTIRFSDIIDPEDMKKKAEEFINE